MSRVLPAPDMEEVLDRLDRLERQNAEGVRRIVRLIAGRGKAKARPGFTQSPMKKVSRGAGRDRRFVGFGFERSCS